MLYVLTLLIAVIASFLRSLDFLGLESPGYEQLVQFSDPLVQLAVVGSVFIGMESGWMSGVALFAVFVLLTGLWTFSLASLGLVLSGHHEKSTRARKLSDCVCIERRVSRVPRANDPGSLQSAML